MSTRSEIYEWINGLDPGTAFTLHDYPRYSEMNAGSNQSYAAIKSAKDYGLIEPTGRVYIKRGGAVREYRRLP